MNYTLDEDSPQMHHSSLKEIPEINGLHRDKSAALSTFENEGIKL